MNKIKLRVNSDGIYFLVLETTNLRIPFHYESKDFYSVEKIGMDLAMDLQAAFVLDVEQIHSK